MVFKNFLSILLSISKFQTDDDEIRRNRFTYVRPETSKENSGDWHSRCRQREVDNDHNFNLLGIIRITITTIYLLHPVKKKKTIRFR